MNEFEHDFRGELKPELERPTNPIEGIVLAPARHFIVRRSIYDELEEEEQTRACLEVWDRIAGPYIWLAKRFLEAGFKIETMRIRTTELTDEEFEVEKNKYQRGRISKVELELKEKERKQRVLIEQKIKEIEEIAGKELSLLELRFEDSRKVITYIDEDRNIDINRK